MEFSKKFKVLLSFYVAIIGILKQRKPESIFFRLVKLLVIDTIFQR